MLACDAAIIAEMLSQEPFVSNQPRSYVNRRLVCEVPVGTG